MSGPRTWSRALWSIAASILVLIAVMVGPEFTRAAGPTVIIGKSFQPSPITIVRGQTVTWVNKDNVAHFIASDLNRFPQSGRIDPGKSYAVKFSNVGTYGYHDAFYDTMTGTVIVKDGPAPAATAKATPRPTPRPTARATVGPAATPRATPHGATPRPTNRAKATLKSSAAVALGPAGSGGPNASGRAAGSLAAGAASTPVGSSTGSPDLPWFAIALLLVVLAFLGGMAIRRPIRRPSPVPERHAASATESMPTDDELETWPEMPSDQTE